MSKTVSEGFRSTLRVSYQKQCQCIEQINRCYKGKDVLLKHGKCKGRIAQIQNYYFDHGKEYLHVFIYRLDNREGFKGREKFIDDHAREFIEFTDCEFV